MEYGPEDYRLTSRYYLMSETLRNQGKTVEARNVLAKVVSIWKECLFRKLCHSVAVNPDELSIVEAFDNLKNGLLVLENELGTVHPLVGECEEAIGLIEMERGDFQIASEHLQRAYEILNNSVGQFDKRTEDAQEVLKWVG